jgi:hypothetical protein
LAFQSEKLNERFANVWVSNKLEVHITFLHNIHNEQVGTTTMSTWPFLEGIKLLTMLYVSKWALFLILFYH